MMEQRANEPGAKTSEFWLTAVLGIVLAALGLMVGYGYLTQEQADLWYSLAGALAPAVIALAMAWLGAAYNTGRVELKKAAIENSE